jgi:hypothetical protein
LEDERPASSDRQEEEDEEGGGVAAAIRRVGLLGNNKELNELVFFIFASSEDI